VGPNLLWCVYTSISIYIYIHISISISISKSYSWIISIYPSRCIHRLRLYTSSSTCRGLPSFAVRLSIFLHFYIAISTYPCLYIYSICLSRCIHTYIHILRLYNPCAPQPVLGPNLLWCAYIYVYIYMYIYLYMYIYVYTSMLYLSL